MITTTHATRTMAILAFSALVGCSSTLPVAPPTLDEIGLRLYSTDSTHTLTITLTKHYQGIAPNLRFEVATSNHAGLFKQLLDSETPYFVTSQLPLNITPSVWAAPIAQDGLVIITNHNNPVNNISLEDIRRIYSGNLTNWQDLGGNEQAIVVFSREEGADTRAEFERLVMGDRRTTPNAQLVTSAETTLTRISEEAGGIAYIALNQVNNSARILTIQNIAPTHDSMTDSTYALRSTIYIVGLEEPQNEYRDFFAWIQSAEGQAIIAQYFVALPR
jgi:phosphate transport system substrate-binding protein